MLIALLATIILAIYSSSDDFKEIVANKKIRHGAQWLFRAAVVTLVCYLLKCLLFAIPLAFLFSAVFRYKLNKKQGLDWRYIGPWSSVYDAVPYLPASKWYTGHWPTIAGIEYDKKLYHIYKSQQVIEAIHAAGTMAYIFEAVAFVCGSILYLLYA